MSLTTSQIATLPVYLKDGRAIPKLHPDTATLYLRVSPQRKQNLDTAHSLEWEKSRSRTRKLA